MNNFAFSLAARLRRNRSLIQRSFFLLSRIFRDEFVTRRTDIVATGLAIYGHIADFFRQVLPVFFYLRRMFIVDTVNTAHGKIMKRFVVAFILVAVITAVLTYNMPTDFAEAAKDLSADGTACIYCRSTDMPSVDMGSGRIVCCSTRQLGDALSRCEGIDGISISFDGDIDSLQRIVARLGVTNQTVQRLDDLTVVCGYSRAIRGGVIVDGRKVNVQLACRDGTITVGSPLILGGY